MYQCGIGASRGALTPLLVRKGEPHWGQATPVKEVMFTSSLVGAERSVELHLPWPYMIPVVFTFSTDDAIHSAGRIQEAEDVVFDRTKPEFTGDLFPGDRKLDRPGFAADVMNTATDPFLRGDTGDLGRCRPFGNLVSWHQRIHSTVVSER